MSARIVCLARLVSLSDDSNACESVFGPLPLVEIVQPNSGEELGGGVSRGYEGGTRSRSW